MIPPNIPLPLPMNLPPAMGGGAMPVLPTLPRMVPPPNLRTSQPASVTNTSATPSVANIAGLKTSNLAPSGSDNEKVRSLFLDLCDFHSVRSNNFTNLFAGESDYASTTAD